MQRSRSLLVPAVLTTWMLSASAPLAQEPAPAGPPGEPPAAGERPEGPRGQNPGRRRNRRGRRPGLTVIEAGTVHPVSGPPIEDGVVVIRGERILAVGKQGDLKLPPNTKVHRFPTGHVYPGLIDAQTDAFTDPSLQRDTSLNGGSSIADALVWSGSRDDHLVEHGITTAYVAVRSGAQVRGQGAIVRPQRDGFELWEKREQAALELRLTQGRQSSHPLARQQQFSAAERLFDGLDQYREAQEKYQEALEKYKKDFAAWLEHHRKKNGKDKPAPAKSEGNGGRSKEGNGQGEPKGEGGANQGGEAKRRRGRARPPRPGGDGKQPPTQAEFEAALAAALALLGDADDAQQHAALVQDPPPPPPQPQGKGSKPPAQGGKPGNNGQQPGATAKKDDGPKRPTYPKKVKPDEQKEALLKVLDGELPLRVEAHRADELRAALALQADNEIPLLVLEQAYAADRVVDRIAEQGAFVVLTDVLPHSLAAPGDKRNPYAKFDPTALPQVLDAAGVPFAIASGNARLSPLLPLMAAAAIGRGLSPEAALRAITLTPAEILGIADDTGSLARNKLADVVVTDGPLFATDSKVMLVIAKGRTQYEAKPE